MNTYTTTKTIKGNKFCFKVFSNGIEIGSRNSEHEYTHAVIIVQDRERTINNNKRMLRFFLSNLEYCQKINDTKSAAEFEANAKAVRAEIENPVINNTQEVLSFHRSFESAQKAFQNQENGKMPKRLCFRPIDIVEIVK